MLNLNEPDVRVESVAEHTIDPTADPTLADNNVLLVSGPSVIFNVKKKKYNDLHVTLTFKPVS